jgi:hypothetical protein
VALFVKNEFQRQGMSCSIDFASCWMFVTTTILSTSSYAISRMVVPLSGTLLYVLAAT